MTCFVSKPSRITLVELSIINTSYQKLPFGSGDDCPIGKRRPRSLRSLGLASLSSMTPVVRCPLSLNRRCLLLSSVSSSRLWHHTRRPHPLHKLSERSPNYRHLPLVYSSLVFLSSCRSGVYPNRPQMVYTRVLNPVIILCLSRANGFPFVVSSSCSTHLHPPQSHIKCVELCYLPLIRRSPFFPTPFFNWTTSTSGVSVPLLFVIITHDTVGEIPSCVSSPLPPPVRVVPPLVISITNAAPHALPIRSQGVHRTIVASPSTPP